MFKRKSNTEEEEQRHAQIKEELTKCFSTGLKQLQQKQHLDGELILSNEASNYLCNVLEAIFLHGVKEGVVTKLSSLAQGGYSQDIKTNFWNAVKRVTHRDVVNQIKGLSQITNDVGRCRAWVRLAINDGLMVSYLNSMVSDVSALKSFYYPWAYLMDYEQPGILASHLGGLMGLRFNLSYNSSIFNTWSSTTVSLAGLVPTNRGSTPLIRLLGPSSGDNTSLSVENMHHSFTSVTSSNNSSVGRDLGSRMASSTYTAQVPPNTPSNPSMFNTGSDLEAIKKLTRSSSQASSTCSNTSQASHPDPSGQASDTNSLAADHASRASSKSGSPQEQARNSPFGSNEPSRASPFEAIRQKPREELKREEQRILKEVLAMYDKREEERQEKEEQERAAAREKRIRERMAMMEKERKEKFEKERLERLAEQERLKKLAEQERQEAMKRMVEVRHEATSKHGHSSDHSGSENRGKTHKPHGSKSDVSHSQHHRPAPVTIHQHRTEEHRDVSAVPNESGMNRNSSVGNSLSNMDGWSTASPHHPEAHFEESFETMLKGYHATQGSDRAMATLEDVLDGMEGLPTTPPSDAKETKARQSHSDDEAFVKVELSDEFDDYEIIHSPSEVLDACRIEQMKSLPRFTGLSHQNYTCAAPYCDRGVGHFHGPGRVCHFDGKTYCENCHENQMTYIPAEIVFNWHFKKMKVSMVNYQFLQQVSNEPLLDIEELNPILYSKVSEMNAVKLLRTRLTSLRSYMFTCSETTAQLLKEKALLREHLYNKIHTYSVNDLLDVKSGKLQKLLQDMVNVCLGHVNSCGLCIQKGFICELCRDVKPIFPFEIDNTVKCPACKAVFHKNCKTETIPCPKCVRFARRGKKMMDDTDDYAISPE